MGRYDDFRAFSQLFDCLHLSHRRFGRRERFFLFMASEPPMLKNPFQAVQHSALVMAIQLSKLRQ
jgi:hypothetical protein